ncbi:MAG: DUF1146 family protein [Bacilli bacterium]
MVKFLLYLFVLPLVIYAMDSININNIFKKNKIVQAKIFYILLVFGLSYLVCNFVYDFLYLIK